MTLLAHAIALSAGATPTPPTAPTGGLGGRPLHWLPAADLGLWATRWEGAPGTLGRDDALAHHAIVAAIAATAPCLPVRFGTWLADATAAAALLTARQVSLRAALIRVAGRSELAVTLLWRESAVAPGRGHASAATAPGRPGRRFLEDRQAELAAAQARHGHAEAIAADLIGQLGLIDGLMAGPADLRHAICPTAEVAVSLAVLIPTPAAVEAKDAVSRLVGVLPGIRGVVSGPWPPYSFTAELG